jgi:hypothetical protein
MRVLKGITKFFQGNKDKVSKIESDNKAVHKSRRQRRLEKIAESKRCPGGRSRFKKVFCNTRKCNQRPIDFWTCCKSGGVWI